MNISLFNSQFGSPLSVAIDYWTIRKTLGWNPLKHWQYLRNPKGRSHAEWEFGVEAAVWYMEWLWVNDRAKFYKLKVFSEKQILDAVYEIDHSHEPMTWTTALGQAIQLIERGLLSLMFSASEKDKCVRFKLIHKQPEKWTDYPVEGDLELEKKTIRRCADALAGMDYDFQSLLGFFTKWNIITASGKAKICSGVVAEIASWEHLDIKPRNGWPAVDPNLLDLYLSEHIRLSCLDYIPLRTN